jgi:hypothetical protein
MNDNLETRLIFRTSNSICAAVYDMCYKAYSYTILLTLQSTSNAWSQYYPPFIIQQLENDF